MRESQAEMKEQVSDLFVQQCRIFASRYGLSPGETDILLLFAQGRSAPYIAEKECISQNTVHTHLRRIYLKTEAHNRQDLFNLVQDAQEE